MIGERIKDLRTTHGMTQEELGKLIGVGKSTINKYELGRISILAAKIESLAKVLKVSPGYLMGWEEDKNYEEQAALLLAAFRAAKASK